MSRIEERRNTCIAAPLVTSGALKAVFHVANIVVVLGFCIDELAEGMEPATDLLVGTHVDSFQSGLLLHDPEEHEASQQSTQGADVDGDHVHPLRGPGLDQQGHDQTDGSEKELLHKKQQSFPDKYNIFHNFLAIS